MGRRHDRGAAVVAASDQQSSVYIGPVLAPKQIGISLEHRPHADTGPQQAIVEQERRTCGPVCADDALVAVDGQQQAWGALICRRYRQDPLATELLSKKSLFYGVRRSNRQGAGQRVSAFRALR